MATTSTDDFTADLKDYFQAILVGSFAYGSVFPLVLRTFSDLIPTTTAVQVYLFNAVNIIYFVGPIFLGWLVWLWLKKSSSDDLLFKEDFISIQHPASPARWQRWLNLIPTVLLALLVLFGVWVMRAMSNPFHGPRFIRLLLMLHLAITIGVACLCWLICRKLIWRPDDKELYFNRFRKRLITQWLLGLVVSSLFFMGATTAFFYEHEGINLWRTLKVTAVPKDAKLSITMPFQWENTAKRIKKSLVDHFNTCFKRVSAEADLLNATQKDYNDLTIRVRPTNSQQQQLNRTLPLKSADSLRSMLLTAYKTLNRVTGSGAALRYTDSRPINALLDSMEQSRQNSLFKACYSLVLDSIRLSPPFSNTAYTADFQLLRANQLMPLADNFSEAAEVIRQGADTQSRLLLVEWVKISRIKGLFFLFTFLNLLLCAWFVIRLANEVLVRRPPTEQPAATEQPETSDKPPRQYRELANLRYYIALTVLLILPLFRTIDETSVNSGQPYWFLNLPELVGNVVQPLPNNNATGNFGENEVTTRLEQINQQVKTLNDATRKLERASGSTQKNLRDMQY